MTFFLEFRRFLPLAILVVMAMAYEPFRSGFVFANQSCEWLADWERIQAAIFNRRHIISFGILFLVTAMTLLENRTVKAAMAVFLFSVFLEFEQSFFTTGHCRAGDLIPNLLGIGLAATIFLVGNKLYVRTQRARSNGLGLRS